MNRLAIILLILILGCLAGACVQFRPATLYELEATEPKPPKPDDISLLVATEIFSDDTLNVWGIMDEPGKKAYLSKEIKKAGDASIYISWDRSKADWTGFGAGWDDWAGKDLTGVRDYTAFEFYVRSDSGKMYSLPMVMSLEDYSGASAYAYAGNFRYMERTMIDEEWQRVQVPLTAFDAEEFGADLSNIKQVQFELQYGGSIYIDEIRIVPYEPEPMEPWMVEEVLPDPIALPQMLFQDSFPNNNGGGIMDYACQNIQLTDREKHSGRLAIYAEWDDKKASCKFIGFGMSWHKWRPFDITPIWQKAAVEFYIKTPKAGMERLPVKLVLQDFAFNMAELVLDKRYVESGSFTGKWQKVVCPLSDFKGDWNPQNTKQLNFMMEDAGKMWIDDIRLVSIN